MKSQDRDVGRVSDTVSPVLPPHWNTLSKRMSKEDFEDNVETMLREIILEHDNLSFWFKLDDEERVSE